MAASAEMVMPADMAASAEMAMLATLDVGSAYAAYCVLRNYTDC